MHNYQAAMTLFPPSDVRRFLTLTLRNPAPSLGGSQARLPSSKATIALGANRIASPTLSFTISAKILSADSFLRQSRHGDRRPWEYQYQQSYIPLGKYADTARSLITEFSTTRNGSTDAVVSAASKIILASDDPEVYTAPIFPSPARAQEHILLASKAAFPQAQQPMGAIHKFIDENTGWEGGFFKDVFWGLGTPSTAASRLQARTMSTETLHDAPPSELALQLRGLLGRSYLLDLAVVGQADRVVCGVSSVACRLLAVMMGWEKGVVQGGWVNVDGGYEWVGIA